MSTAGRECQKSEYWTSRPVDSRVYCWPGGEKMRIHILACRVFSRELNALAAMSPHVVELTWLPQGLHNTPDKLRSMLMETLDGLYRQRDEGLLREWPDAIVLGYGLCSNGVVGVESRDTPLVVPKTDDCIAMFLGSQKRYLELFSQYNGCYWLNNGWIEYGWDGERADPQQLAERRAEYARLYGEENADFLMEQDQAWIHNYNACGYITSPVLEIPAYEEKARTFARENGWRYARLTGNIRMLRMLVEGAWTEEEFLICPPYHRIEATYDADKIRAVPIS